MKTIASGGTTVKIKFWACYLSCQPTFTFSKVTIETLEQGMIYVQSQQ